MPEIETFGHKRKIKESKMQAQDTTHLDISATHKNLATALCEAQGEITGAKRNKVNPFYNSNYADITAVFNAIREPFYNNGLSITQLFDVLDNGTPVLITKLMHTSGEFIEGKMLLPKVEDAQKFGKLITYYRRYSLMSIAGIPAEDDDANEVCPQNKPSVKSKKTTPLPPQPPRNDETDGAPFISEKQISEIEHLLAGKPNLKNKILEKYGHIKNLRTDKFDMSINWIRSEITKSKMAK